MMTDEDLFLQPESIYNKYKGKNFEDDAYNRGYHARDVEIERLRAGIKELRHICDGTGGYEGESARARLEMGGDKCDELLKGGGDDI